MGSPVTFTATVTSGGGTPTGSVTFYNSATCSGTALASSVSVNSSGQASFSTAQLAAGSPTITACYSPTGIYLASNGSVSQIVNAAAASISLSAPTVIYPANSVVTVTVSSSAGTPTGNATLVVDGGMPVFAALNGSGVAAFTLTSPSPGGHSLSASYAAQGNFAASGPTAGTLTVDEVPTIASANNTTFTAAVAGSFTVTTVAFPTANLGETGTLPVGVSFTDNGDGTATLAGTATVAGSYPLTITAANGVGQAVQMFTLTVSPGAFAQLQLLVAGETAAPGTTSGKTGPPNTEYVNGAFNVTVNAVDANWNVVNMVTDTVQITSSDAKAVLPANGPLTLGTGTFSVTLETPENPAATTITASDYTDNNKTSDTSPKIEVIVVYTATISPADWATGQQATYTLTVNNAAAPNTNNLASVEIAVPSADQGTIGNVSVSAAQSGGASANWSYDSSMLLPGTMRFFETTANDAVTPGGTITITFTATSNATVSTIPVYEVWSTTAFSDAASHNALPLAPPEPTVSIGAAPAFTSASSTSAFTYGTPGTIFAVTTTGVPTPSLSKTGSFPSWAAFKDNGDGTATISGTPTAAGMSTFTITAHNGFGPDATQTFTLTLNKATVTPSISASNKVYDGTTTASVTCTLAGVVGTDNVTCSAASANFSQAGVGTGLTVTATGITLGGAAAGNYQLSSTMATTTANITTRPITATLMAQNKTYDGTNTEPNANMRCSLTGVLSGDAANVSCTPSSGTFNTSKVATANLVTATVTISGAAAGNYTLGAAGTSTTSTSATATAHITAVAASVTPNAASKTYGTADPAFTGTLTGFLAADGVTATYSRTAGETVAGSPYTISATLSPTGVLGNYNITYNSASFTITPAPASGMLSNLSQTSDGTPKSAAVTTGPLGLSVMVTYNGSATSPTDAGSYTVSASVVDPNYQGSASATLVINAATSSTAISSSENPSNYGDSVSFTATVTSAGGTPTGTVQFVIDGANFGSPVTLSGGTAMSADTTSLAAGQHTITAVYSGSTDFTGSTSPFLIQTVNNALTSIVVTPAKPTIFVGGTQQFTATGTFADGSSAILPTGGTWAVGNSLTSAVRAPMAAAGSNGTLYFFGGQDGGGAENYVQTYNPSTGVWNTVTSTPAMTPRYQGVAVAPGDGKIYVTGGWNGAPTSVVEAYDPVANTWASKTSLGHPSGCSAGGAINSLIYVLTGCDGNAGFSKEFDVYNPMTDTWSSLPSPAHAHNSGAGGVIGGKFYVAGGYDVSNATDVTEVYDPQTNTWTTVASAPAALGELSGGITGGKLYVVGGLDNSSNLQSSVYVYDPVANTWSTGPSLSQGRRDIGLATLEGLLYAAGRLHSLKLEPARSPRHRQRDVGERHDLRRHHRCQCGPRHGSQRGHGEYFRHQRPHFSQRQNTAYGEQSHTDV